MMRMQCVLLGGWLQRPPLAEQTGRSILSLPLERDRSLLRAWLSFLRAETGEDTIIRIAVNDSVEAASLRSHLGAMPRSIASMDIEVVEDVAAWRGTAGLVRDCVSSIRSGGPVLVVEGTCLPPRSLASLVEAISNGSLGVVGSTRRHQPAGVYALKPEALEHVNAVGYMDLKEQLMPRLVASSGTVRVARVADEMIRIRDHISYRHARHAWRQPDARGDTGYEDAHPSPTEDGHAQPPGVDVGARLVGLCVIEEDALVDQDAIVNDSVLLRGARIERGALVSRSIVCEGVTIGSGARVMDQVADTSVAPVNPTRAKRRGGFRLAPVIATRRIERKREITGDFDT